MPVYGVVGPWPSLVLGNCGEVAEPEAADAEAEPDAADAEGLPALGVLETEAEPAETEEVSVTGEPVEADGEPPEAEADAGLMLEG